MTNNEIAVRREPQVLDTWVDVVAPTQTLAEYVARTEFVPKALRGNAPAVLATMMTGRELGIGPMTALRSLDVIEGSVQMKTKAILARIFKAGHRVEWFEHTDKACEIKIERGDGLTQAQVRWTMADAQRAGLAGKAVWQKYPRSMLRSRAVSECAELVCPDVILGLEVGDDLDSGAFAPSAPAAAPTVIQVGQEPTQSWSPPAPAPEPAPVPAQPPVAPQSDAQAPAPEPDAEPAITPAQMRKIGALIGELETAEGRKYDRVERRRMIGFMAGLPDPDALESANNLTLAQASAAIETLISAIEVASAEEAEVIEVEDPPE